MKYRATIDERGGITFDLGPSPDVGVRARVVELLRAAGSGIVVELACMSDDHKDALVQGLANVILRKMGRAS